MIDLTLEDLKQSSAVVGMKETQRAVEKKMAQCVFVASDCDEEIIQFLNNICIQYGVPIITSFTKKEIGRACHIKVKASACAVIDFR